MLRLFVRRQRPEIPAGFCFSTTFFSLYEKTQGPSLQTRALLHSIIPLFHSFPPFFLPFALLNKLGLILVLLLLTTDAFLHYNRNRFWSTKPFHLDRLTFFVPIPFSFFHFPVHTFFAISARNSPRHSLSLSLSFHSSREWLFPLLAPSTVLFLRRAPRCRRSCVPAPGIT